jgi:subtilisin-like proprotein convertase family protein
MVMKIKLILGLLLAAATLPAQVTTSYTNSPGQLLPDNDPDGYGSVFNVSGLGGMIANVEVGMDVTGGYNGDLYAYLVSPTGQIAILLNRMGVSAANAYGYNTAGFNITLDSAPANNNEHDYESFGPNYSGGQLTGTWAPDGRNISPNSTGSLFDSTASTMGLDNDFGTDPNGTWLFFIADLSPGSQSTLQNVTLTISTAPEPQTWAILAGGVALFGLVRRRNVGRHAR